MHVRVDDDRLVSLDVIEIEALWVPGVRLGLRDRGGVVCGRAVVGDVRVDASMLELGQRPHEDAVRVRQNTEQGLSRVAEGVDHEQLSPRHGDRPRTQDVPHVVVDALQRRAHADMRRHEGREIDGLELVQPSARVEQTQGVPGDDTSQGVSDHAQLLDVVPARGQLLQGLFDLVRDALATKLDPIVGETSGIAFCGENNQTVLAVSFAEGGGHIVEVVRVTPQTAE